MAIPARMIARAALVTFIAVSALGFATISSRLEKIPRRVADSEMQVALPRFIQIALAGGDRFLAANTSVFRALMVGGDLKQADRYEVQSKIQHDAALLNPRHEDNYYLAAAMLSWNGQVDTAQQILESANDTRPFDWQPGFYYAFNQFYFRHDPIGGAQWLKKAATHTDNIDNQMWLNRIAASWIVKGQNRQQALTMLEAMAAQSHYGTLRRAILQRAERLRHLIQLDEAINLYIHRYNHQPISLEALVESKVIASLPQDPLGQGYLIDAQAKAQIKPPPKK